MTDVFVASSINQDFVLRLERRPEPGETVTDAELGLYGGGKGANQAVAAALLGSRAAMLGRVGADGFGKDLLARLGEKGVDTSYVRAVEDVPTGSAFITVTLNGQNAIVVSPGANLRLTPEEVDEVADEIRAAGVLVVQMEIAPETVYRAVQAAAAGGTRVVLNLAPPRKPPLPVMRVLDPLVVNESEAAFLLGDSFAGTEAALGAASGLLQLGCRSAVITLGAAGAVVAEGEIVAHFPAPEVQVVDTTAAGDAFVGALAGVLVSGRPVAEAAEYAVLAGAAAASKNGAQDSLPTPGSVEAL